MFQTPISAPTISRIKMADMASEMPLTISSPSFSQVWPFLCATTAPTTALISSATCSGPVAASIPKITIESVSSTIMNPKGIMASNIEGGRMVGTCSDFICATVSLSYQRLEIERG